MFNTLMSKTFIILTLSLTVAWFACMFAARLFDKALQMQDYAKIRKYNIWAFFVFIGSFLLMMFMHNSFPLNMLLMALFTASSGFSLGIYFIAYGDTAQKALSLTVLTTFLTGIIAMYSGLDFEWMGKFLFIALIILVIYSLISIFVRIRGRKIMAGLGVLIFTGYLLFDFNRLAKLKAVADANNWDTALNFAISIYLDIINLFINLINLMTSNN
ncbi:MAG: Bax inhibitor-1 family protein [Elusimicrobiaceae bacterium]|nr:Bax inhibitor-1 family protein [Elusimicrobiaceae bacterium]